MITDVTSTTATVHWEYPGGNVDAYLVQYIQSLLSQALNVTVDSNFTSFTLTRLEPLIMYSVVVLTINSNGFSISSPLASFYTPMCELTLSLPL